MELIFDSSDREDFRVRGPDGALLYIAQTPEKNLFSANCTILSRPLAALQPIHGGVETGVIAKLWFRSFGEDEIEFLGRRSSVEALFPKKGWPSR